VFFRVAYELDTVRTKPLNVLERFGDALAGESIKRPNQKYVKPPLGGIGEHSPELFTIGSPAAFAVDVFG